MIKQKPITSYKEIADRCLSHRYGKGPKSPTDLFGCGWDRGSPAHKWAVRWAERQFNILKKMTWREIYKLYDNVIDAESCL